MSHVERVVLDTLIQKPSLWPEHGARLTTDDFTGDRKAIFSALRKRCIQTLPVDLVVLHDDLPESVQLGGEIEMLAGTGSPWTIEEYLAELKQNTQNRMARQIGLSLAETGDAAEARRALDTLHMGGGRITDSIAASGALLEEIEKRTEGKIKPIKTGLSKLDAMMSIEPGDLCVIAARPSMGKSALMLNIARRSGVPFGVFSLEMPTSQLMARMVAMQGVDYGRLRHPERLTDEDWPKITEANQSINAQGAWFEDTGGLPLDRLEASAYQMVRENGAKLICVDYLQLVTLKAESRLEVVSEISRRMKALAKNLSVPIILLSQLNRSVETRGGDPIPRLSDLRESGQIEQDADQVLFIYRPSAYKPNIRPGEADIIIGKSRNGETGDTTVAWQGKHQKFVDLYRDHYPRAA